MNYTEKAKEIRKSILKMVFEAKTGHIGGSMSCVDILVSLFYGKHLIFNSKKPKLVSRDRLIISKGHATAAFYSILAHLGYIKKSELKTYCKNNTRLATHLSQKVPGVEFDTGSLGHGLGVACGIAFSARLDKKKYKTFALISDGELYEGSIWEALLFAGHHKLTNLVIIIDRNKQIVMDKTEDCIKLNPLEKKIKSFGYSTVSINGHSYNDLNKTFKKIKKKKLKKPLVIIANTIKGKGVSFMEKNIKWHHAVPKKEEYNNAVKELS
jgi:transketolase